MEPLVLMSDGKAATGTFHDVVSVVLVRDDHVLLVHRAPDRFWGAGAWDLPGGHIESGETSTEAATREAFEELGVAVRVTPSSLFARLEGVDYRVAYYLVDSWVGEPANAAPAEHVAVRWWPRDDLEDLCYADHNVVPILRRALTGAA